MAYTEGRVPGRPLLSYFPLSFLYKLAYAVTIVSRFPFWILGYALARRWRLHPAWTFRQTLMVHLTKAVVQMTCRVETPQPLSLKPGKEKERFEIMEPFPEDVYRGPLDDYRVRPATIGGTWFPKKPEDPQNADLKIVLHIHGGGFVIGDGRTAQLNFLATTLLEQAGIDAIFSPQYRLASRPTAAPFPAALQDTLTSYLYLVRTLGIAPRNITLSGDSAGGNLAIALLRYLGAHGTDLALEPPRAAFLIAPWVAPLKHLWPRLATTSNPNYGTDFLGTELPAWGARAYARLVSAADPHISPLGHAFATPVPLFASFGSAEMFAVDGAQWVREMRRVEGNVVEVNWEEAAPHDTLLVGGEMGFEESAREVARRIRVFLRKN